MWPYALALGLLAFDSFALGVAVAWLMWRKDA